MALDSTLVGIVYTKMTLTYGTRFLTPYEHAGLKPDEVRANWAHELDGVRPDAVHWALRHLPADWPPNVLQFRELCKQAPRREEALRLGHERGAPPTRAQRERLMATLQRLEGDGDPLRWAHRLRERERSGEFLSRMQRFAWRAALNTNELFDAEETGG